MTQYMPPQERRDDAVLAVVRRAIQPDTTKSLRRTLNACLLIMIVRRPASGSIPVRRVAMLASGLAALAATVQHWHVLAILFGNHG